MNFALYQMLSRLSIQGGETVKLERKGTPSKSQAYK